MSYTPTLGSKRVYTISSTWGPKLGNNRIHQNPSLKPHKYLWKIKAEGVEKRKEEN